MIRLIHIYVMLLKNNIASRMAYRGDFFISCFMLVISDMLVPMVTFLIYRTGSSFPGWDLNEVLLLQGVFILSKGAANLLFFEMVWNTLDHVREGTYDLFLIKPVSTLFLSVAHGFDIDGIGSFLSGGIIVGLTLNALPAPGMLQWTGFFLFFGLSIVVQFSFSLFMTGSLFKWVGNSRIYEIYGSFTSFGNYPASIFSKCFRTIIVFIIPVSFIGFYPASMLLGKEASHMLPAAAVCLAFLAAGLMFWKYMLTKYTSAGG